MQGNRRKALETYDVVRHFGLQLTGDALVAVELTAKGIPCLEEDSHPLWWETANRHAANSDAWLTKLVIGRVAQKLATKYGKKVVTNTKA